MSHYAESYEASRQSDARRRKDDLLRWIPEKLEDMENHELEVMYEVAQNVEDYYGLLSLIKRVAKTSRI